MSASDNDTVATSEAISDALLTPAGGSGDPALPDADPASSDAVVEPIDVEDGTDEDADEGGDGLLVREGDVAGDYLERLLDILDVDGDIDLDVEGDRASVAVVGGQLKTLIGPDGATLEALQELTRLAVAQATGVRSRLMLDIGGFRAKRRADLTSLASEAAERVAESGAPERLAPMNPFERKVVHDVIAAATGVRSESEGEEPNRRVVVLPDR
ncbi:MULTISPECIES: Jag family protein [unclassified Modestobacter]|uniref:Jag family protein n=1 Tax=unclassified Modestobacter TaxID=2643866 RepID=UPI0022AA4221|nr:MULTISPECIES: protein jag [unclassified Modestobacter]MCZ2822992.1 protein jag [Modestobacter sp. VKM Ac-2981]MCZ2851238.1 protein jag [Modestobacter sp. VKM Ac-2982]